MMKELKQKIVNVKLVSMGSTDTKVTDAVPKSVVMNHTGERIKAMDIPEMLCGKRYKIKAPNAKAATYVQVNDLVLDPDTHDELTVPYEVFIISKDIAHLQWMVAMTRTLSAMFRQGIDCNFLLDEYMEVPDPAGGGYLKRGNYVSSLVAEIGMVIKNHIANLNSDPVPTDLKEATNEDYPETATVCIECKSKAVIYVENCPRCLACGDSKCG